MSGSKKEVDGCGFEIIPDRLYFLSIASQQKAPVSTITRHYFSTDEEFIYSGFFEDFGPLNLAMVHRYRIKLDHKLQSKLLSNKTIIHWSRHNTKQANMKCANAAFLIGAYAVIRLQMSPEEACTALHTAVFPYMDFRDASYGPCPFMLSILHCLQGLSKALLYKFIDFETFDVNAYEHYERVENGDFNWIVDGRFLAFCGPRTKTNNDCGRLYHCPEEYIEYFTDHGVTAVIRLNKAAYKGSKFTEANIWHYDLYFVDGSTPSDEILNRFLTICEQKTGAIAVHCKAGLGRTGTLIGCYLMKHFHLTAPEAIAWIRIARPGSVIGPQQNYMIQKQEWLWNEGDKYKLRSPQQSSPLTLSADLSIGNNINRSLSVSHDPLGGGDGVRRGRESGGGGGRESGGGGGLDVMVNALNIADNIEVSSQQEMSDGQGAAVCQTKETLREKQQRLDRKSGNEENKGGCDEQDEDEEDDGDELNRTQGDYLLELKQKRDHLSRSAASPGGGGRGRSGGGRGTLAGGVSKHGRLGRVTRLRTAAIDSSMSCSINTGTRGTMNKTESTQGVIHRNGAVGGGAENMWTQATAGKRSQACAGTRAGAGTRASVVGLARNQTATTVADNSQGESSSSQRPTRSSLRL